MTSAWLQAKGKAQERPITTDTNPFDTQSYDLAEATNDDIDSLNADKDRYFNSLIEQYNHMFKVQENLPDQILNLTKSGSEVKKHVDRWLETEKEVQWLKNLHKEMRDALQKMGEMMTKDMKNNPDKSKKPFEIIKNIIIDAPFGPVTITELEEE